MRLLCNRRPIVAIVILGLPSGFDQMIGGSPVSGPESARHVKQMPRPSVARARKAADGDDWPLLLGRKPLKRSAAVYPLPHVFVLFPVILGVRFLSGINRR